MPTCIEELIPELAEVKIIDRYVDAMDITQLGFKADIQDENGWPGFDSKDMIKSPCKMLDDINSLFLSLVK